MTGDDDDDVGAAVSERVIAGQILPSVLSLSQAAISRLKTIWPVASKTALAR